MDGRFFNITRKKAGYNTVGVIFVKKEKKRYITPIPLWSNGIGATPSAFPIITDPNGSYTGRPDDPEDKPIQDADDL